MVLLPAGHGGGLLVVAMAVMVVALAVALAVVVAWQWWWWGKKSHSKAAKWSTCPDFDLLSQTNLTSSLPEYSGRLLVYLHLRHSS
jgi:flagellar basal body-associated protein FliL